MEMGHPGSDHVEGDRRGGNDVAGDEVVIDGGEDVVPCRSDVVYHVDLMLAEPCLSALSRDSCEMTCVPFTGSSSAGSTELSQAVVAQAVHHPPARGARSGVDDDDRLVDQRGDQLP